MDDWVSGTHSVEERKKCIAEENACLSSGGSTLQKWSANDKQLITTLEQAKNTEKTLFTLKSESASKTLAIQWNCTGDKSTFQSNLASSETIKLINQDGILRIEVRLKNANISIDIKYPIIIPYSGQQSPSWPSAEGIWERSIKEYSTVLAKIEANLNSTPLCPTSDVIDIDFLTPTHSLNSRAGLSVIDTADDGRTRWPLAKKIVQDKWKRWKTEYLTQLLSILPVQQAKPDEKDVQQNQQSKETENSKQTEATATKRKRTSTRRYPKFVNVAYLAFIFFMSVIWSSEASYNFTQLPNNQSVYFDPMGKMHLIRDQWKIVVYYNMQPYWQANKAVNTFIKHLEQSCDKVKEPSHCRMIFMQIQHEQSELDYCNQLLLNQHFSAPSRTRRGLINAVGSIANTLFGVLDDSFAEQFKHDIELVN